MVLASLYFSLCTMQAPTEHTIEKEYRPARHGPVQYDTRESGIATEKEYMLRNGVYGFGF